jgi:hypothetical protein
LVHNPFSARKEGGIEIFRVKARKRYEVPETIWDKDFFEARFREIDDFGARLAPLFWTLKTRLTHKDFIKSFLGAHSGQQVPTGSFLWPGVVHPPPLPLRASMDSPPHATTPSEGRGTPEDQNS